MPEQEAIELIAMELCKRDNNIWSGLSDTYYHSRAKIAFDVIKQAGYVRLAEDQSLPNKWTYAGNVHGDDYNSGYSTAQQDMLKANFRKVELCREKEKCLER